MNGPYPAGSHDEWSRLAKSSLDAQRLDAGRAYHVVRSFCDADGDQHTIGDEWVFITSMFSKFDDEYSLCVRTESNEEWRIPLIWTPECQQHIIEDVQSYVAPIDPEYHS